MRQVAWSWRTERDKETKIDLDSGHRQRETDEEPTQRQKPPLRGHEGQQQ